MVLCGLWIRAMQVTKMGLRYVSFLGSCSTSCLAMSCAVIRGKPEPSSDEEEDFDLHGPNVANEGSKLVRLVLRVELSILSNEYNLSHVQIVST